MAEGCDIRFKSKVTLIEHQGDGSGHVVRTEAGEEYRTARVLVAAPVTAYRPGAEGSFAFSPRIPALEAAAAEAFEGWAVKVLLSFTRRFWDPSMLLVFCADSVVSQIWADPPRPTYAEAGECHVLTGFITGSQAKAASGWSAWEIVDAFLKQLDAMFATQEVPRPASDAKDDHSICNWVTYGDICASYTSPTKGSADREASLLVSAPEAQRESLTLAGWLAQACQHSRRSTTTAASPAAASMSEATPIMRSARSTVPWSLRRQQWSGGSLTRCRRSSKS